MHHNFINIAPTVLFKLQGLKVQQMAPLVSAHWSLFEFSQQRHDMMMNDDDITRQIITYLTIMILLCFFLILYII